METEGKMKFSKHCRRIQSLYMSFSWMGVNAKLSISDSILRKNCLMLLSLATIEVKALSNALEAMLTDSSLLPQNVCSASEEPSK